MKFKKIKASKRIKSVAFATLMSFITSSIVSSIVVISTQKLSDFYTFWLHSVFRAWPIVFILILIFVPVLNKLLDFFLDTNDKESNN